MYRLDRQTLHALPPTVEIKSTVGAGDAMVAGLVAGLQYYAGSSESEGSYASKVLAEKERLEQAARRSSPANA